MTGFLVLRGAVAALAAYAFIAVRKALRLTRAPPARASATEIERARPIVRSSRWTYPNLVFRGDKALIFSESGTALLMYGRMRRTWVALGDPVGPPEEARDLARRFRELCRSFGGRPVFFEVRDENRQVYLELGLSLTQLGEEARVELALFDLSTARYAELRQAKARVLRKGCSFDVVAPAGVPALSAALKRVSDEWLAAKTTDEKGFSNASFDMHYLAHFPLAVVRDASGVIAFANIWQSAGKEELSVDLMRHRPDAPNGTMDFLFTELLLWGKREGFRWFNLGMAPLSGLDAHAGSPIWRRFGMLLYQHGEHFYNFRGLRRYKDKFGPVWTPRYLASPGGLALPVVLVDVTALIAGGLRGIVLKRAAVER